jgi:hypothetical protein
MAWYGPSVQPMRQYATGGWRVWRQHNGPSRPQGIFRSGLTPEAVCRALPHMEKPHVRVRMTAQHACGRGIIIAVARRRSGLHVNRHEIAIVF